VALKESPAVLTLPSTLGNAPASRSRTRSCPGAVSSRVRSTDFPIFSVMVELTLVILTPIRFCYPDQARVPFAALPTLPTASLIEFAEYG